MKRKELLLLAFSLGAALLLAVGCATATPTPTPTPPAGWSLSPEQLGIALERVYSSAAWTGSLPFSSSNSQQAGIWVTGQGVVRLEPDVAMLSLGVEATGSTVEEARTKAAEAMAGIFAALKARLVEEKDIRTSYFSIQPQYTYREVTHCVPQPVTPLPGEKGLPSECYTEREQVLIGYTVNNQVSVKLRDLDNAGVVIDETARAGGDCTRIQGIQFTVEDDSAARVQAREKAVKEALAKAQQFTQLTGANLGKLVYITESTTGVYPREVFKAGAEYALMATPAPPTPISGGELEVTASVQAVFGIE